MSIGLLFWLLMVLWLVLGFWAYAPDLRTGRYGIVGGNLLLFILCFCWAGRLSDSSSRADMQMIGVNVPFNNSVTSTEPIR